MPVSPATCLRCRGRKWAPVKALDTVILVYEKCRRCGNSGCRVAEHLRPEFFDLPPHPGLATGRALAGEIEAREPREHEREAA